MTTMRIEAVIAAVMAAGFAVGIAPAVLSLDEPPAQAEKPHRNMEVCWRRTESGDLTWAEFPIGGTCPFDAPEADPDQPVEQEDAQ
jgi:hypothetical protein